jgi:tetratricopeptide (TPR) repeat protein
MKLRGAALALMAALALAGCRRTPPLPSPAPVPSAGPARKILLVGLDAADWEAIEPLVARGRLPTFARLLGAGHTATLVSTPPLVSPMIWTTIATGRPPDQHGVLDFMADLPGGGQAPVGAAQRQVPALWSLFSAAQRSVAVVGWWATWPAENVRGTIVSDQLAPQLLRRDPALESGLVSPAAAAPSLLPLLVRAEQVPLDELRRFAPLTEAERAEALAASAGGRFYASRTAHLAAIVAGTRTHVAIALRLLRGTPQPDLAAVYLEVIDTVSHRFVADAARGPQAIEQAYAEADAALGLLAAAVAPDTWVVVCSDHGFQPRAAGVKEDPADLAGPATAWHRPYGMAAAAEARELVVGGAAPATRGPAFVTPLDLAPTVLHAAGLPVEPAMTGRVVPELVPKGRAGVAPVRGAYAVPTPAPAPAERVASIDEAALARLQALGYVGSRPSSQARQNLGEVLYRAGRLEAAERAFRSAAEAQPGALASWLWLARTQQALGRTPEALLSWRQALPLPGGADAALVPAVEAALAAQRGDEAARLLAEARGAAPAVLHTARGMIAAGAPGGDAAALRALRAALAADPTSYDALFRLFELLHRAGRAQDALPPLRRAARAVPASPRHAALLGEGYLAVGDAAAAAGELARALALAPDGTAVRLDLARALLMQKRAEEAGRILQPAPPSPQRSLLLGAASAAQARWADAATHYRDALAGSAPTPEVLNGLGWALHKQGRDPEAADALRRSLALRADQPHIRALLGTLGS